MYRLYIPWMWLSPSTVPIKKLLLIWVREIHANKDGKTDTVNLMETWLTYKDGKADWLLQYD